MNTADMPLASLNAVKAQDREGWLALFEDDAVVQDPVGPCEWDPTGEGQNGKEAIGRFYDMFMGFQKSLDFEIYHQVVRGNEAAVSLTLHVTMKDGTTQSSRAINIYKASENGKIASLRSFW